MQDEVIKASSVNFSFDEQKVLSDICLSVKKGEFIGVIGPNGAGKSTLIRLLAGLLEVNEGQIYLAGENIRHFSRKKIARMLGYVPQNVDLVFSFKVHEVVAMGRYPYLHGFLQDDDIHARMIINDALNWMDLNLLKDRPFTALSGGEKQRAIIASVLAQQAKILLLDEPTSALDLKHQQNIYRILKELTIKEQKTIILVTHEINLASQFCSRLILLDKGRILADGTPDEILKFSIIQQVYGVKVYIDVNPFTDSLYILPYDTI